jgi:hypothetical protein
MLAQTTLRSVLGQHELDEMLSNRATLKTDVQDILDARTKHWGIDVSAVEIRDIQLTDNMVKAIAKQAEAERDRRAKVIHADAFPMPIDIVKPFLDLVTKNAAAAPPQRMDAKFRRFPAQCDTGNRHRSVDACNVVAAAQNAGMHVRVVGDTRGPTLPTTGSAAAFCEPTTSGRRGVRFRIVASVDLVLPSVAQSTAF